MLWLTVVSRRSTRSAVRKHLTTKKLMQYDFRDTLSIGAFDFLYGDSAAVISALPFVSLRYSNAPFLSPAEPLSMIFTSSLPYE
jgi:hypothetical protein